MGRVGGNRHRAEAPFLLIGRPGMGCRTGMCAIMWSILVLLRQGGWAMPPVYNPAAWNAQKRFSAKNIPADLFLMVCEHTMRRIPWLKGTRRLTAQTAGLCYGRRLGRSGHSCIRHSVSSGTSNSDRRPTARPARSLTLLVLPGPGRLCRTHELRTPHRQRRAAGASLPAGGLLRQAAVQQPRPPL